MNITAWHIVTLPQGLGLRAGEERRENEGAGPVQVVEEIPLNLKAI